MWLLVSKGDVMTVSIFSIANCKHGALNLENHNLSVFLKWIGHNYIITKTTKYYKLQKFGTSIFCIDLEFLFISVLILIIKEHNQHRKLESLSALADKVISSMTNLVTK